MFNYSKNNLVWLNNMIAQLPDGVFILPVKQLSQATIGQHVRHIVEMYQGLENGYEKGLIEYDKRNRDRRIETDTAFAEKVINEIIAGIDKADKRLQVVYEIDDREIVIESNYQREVMYNMEHAIHHMALIKVALLELTNIILPEQFGVAPTTLQYRAQCAQ